MNNAAVNSPLHTRVSASDCFLWIHFWKLWNTGSEGVNIWKHSECLLVKHLSGSSCPEWLFSTLGFLLHFSWRIQLEYCINGSPPSLIPVLGFKTRSSGAGFVHLCIPLLGGTIKIEFSCLSWKPFLKAVTPKGFSKSVEIVFTFRVNRTCCKTRQYSETHF